MKRRSWMELCLAGDSGVPPGGDSCWPVLWRRGRLLSPSWGPAPQGALEQADLSGCVQFWPRAGWHQRGPGGGVRMASAYFVDESNVTGVSEGAVQENRRTAWSGRGSPGPLP